MTFYELYEFVKKKFHDHPEMMLNFEKLAVQIVDISDYGSFYILWENNKCSVEPFPYQNYDICIMGTLAEMKQMFTESQYLIQEDQQLNIEGSFCDVMRFQKLLSYITDEHNKKQNSLSQLIAEQKIVRGDLEIIMQSLQLLITNSLISLPENYVSAYESQKKNSKESQEFEQITFGGYEWYILQKNQNGEALLLSKHILKSAPFSNGSVKFTSSLVYSWLHTSFKQKLKQNLINQNQGRIFLSLGLLTSSSIEQLIPSVEARKAPSKFEWWLGDSEQRYIKIVTDTGAIGSAEPTRICGIRPAIVIKL